MDRRDFIRNAGLAAGGLAATSTIMPPGIFSVRKSQKQIEITGVSSDFEREPLIRPSDSREDT